MAKPKKVKMKGVPKGAFGGMGDTVQGMVSPTKAGMKKIGDAVQRLQRHPKYPGK